MIRQGPGAPELALKQHWPGPRRDHRHSFSHGTGLNPVGCARRVFVSEIFGTEPGVFRDFREGYRANLFAIVEAKREVTPSRPLQLPVRANLLL